MKRKLESYLSIQTIIGKSIARIVVTDGKAVFFDEDDKELFRLANYGLFDNTGSYFKEMVPGSITPTEIK